MWELAAIEIPSTETISGFLELSKMWDFPGLAFKWLFLFKWSLIIDVFKEWPRVIAVSTESQEQKIFDSLIDGFKGADWGNISCLTLKTTIGENITSN